mgnify:CR=1 FL=1
MKIELEQNNKVFVFEGSNKWELHPIWLRERVSEEEHLDKNTEQRPVSYTHLTLPTM